MRRAIQICALSLASALAQPSPEWFGLRPSASAPNAVELVTLDDGAVVRAVLGAISLDAGAVAATDAFRCIQDFCLFAAGVPGGAGSTVYKVRQADAGVEWSAPCPGACEHMHVDYTSGDAYTLSINGGVTAVVEVSQPHAYTVVVDISAAVAGGTVRPGQTTHCSAYKHMYVGVTAPGGGAAIVSVDLVARAVDRVMPLPAGRAMFDSLWATCDGSGTIGGVSWTPGAGAVGNSTAEFGTLDAAGRYTARARVGVPAGLEPTGLLTATSPATYADQFLAAA